MLKKLSRRLLATKRHYRAKRHVTALQSKIRTMKDLRYNEGWFNLSEVITELPVQETIVSSGDSSSVVSLILGSAFWALVVMSLRSVVAEKQRNLIRPSEIVGRKKALKSNRGRTFAIYEGSNLRAVITELPVQETIVSSGYSSSVVSLILGSAFWALVVMSLKLGSGGINRTTGSDHPQLMATKRR